MRPLRLEVEGFTCYRDRQPPLDFSELSLFAIAGPTGAGKSSILDTMLYALYGQVPRLGKQGIADAISHNRDALSVCLDFEVQKVRYRVVRRAKRRGKGSAVTTATLVELPAADASGAATTAGGEKPLADGVREVNERLETLLGLGYDEFTQTVILPQGEFARFLRAEPKGQREILQHLLRHGVFERMRAAADERRRAQSEGVREVAGQLTMCDHATAEAFEACAESLSSARTRFAQAREAKDAADVVRREARHQHELTKEAERLRADRDGLKERASEIEAARRELQDARRAAEVRPRLEALKTANCRVARAAEAYDIASRAAASAKKTRDAAAKAVEKTTTDAEVVNELRLRVRRLDEIAGDLVTRRQHEAALRDIPARIKAAAAELKTARNLEASARKATGELETRLASARQAFDALQFDEARHARLEAVRDDVANARARLRERDLSAAEAESCVKAHAEARRNRTAAEAACGAARERKDQAARIAEAAAAALEDGRTHHRAAALRAHLHAGDECPVCLQTVEIIPDGEVSVELDALETAAKDAARRAAAADGEWQEAAIALARIGARETEADNAQREAAAKASRSAAAFAEAMAPLAELAAGGGTSRRGKPASLRARRSASRDLFADERGGEDANGDAGHAGHANGAAVGTAVSGAVGTAVGGAVVGALDDAIGAVPKDETKFLAWLDDQRAALQAIKTARDRHDAEVRNVQEDLSAAQLAMAKAAATVDQQSERHDGLLREQTRLKSDLASVITRIEAVTTHPDPSSERDDIARKIEALAAAVRNASEALARAEVDTATADAQLKAAADTHADARDHVADTQELVRQALAATGFPSEDDASAAVRDAAQQQALEQQVNIFEQKRAAVLERLGHLERDIAGREVSAAALAAIEAEYNALEADWREADQAVVRLEGEHARLGQDVQRREQLLAQHRVLEASLSITSELATDLRGDRFQEYLLEEAFKTLVASASVRMQAMSNRYTLGWEAGEFYVIDHDNAGERRRAETLSGGETFMASLCLALQLGEEVLRTSGALQMDSLFIDEGFGTLDSDSLSEVTDAIESLRQDGGRLIGVISHRHELTERLPGCIRVDKGIGESRWSVERVG